MTVGRVVNDPVRSGLVQRPLGLNKRPDRTTSNFQKYIFLLIFTIIIFKTHCKSYLLNFEFNVQIHKYNLRSQITSNNQ